jgi:hypothetical protein
VSARTFPAFTPARLDPQLPPCSGRTPENKRLGVIRTTTRTTTGTTTSRRSTSLYNGRLLAAQQETQQNSGLRWWVAVHGGRPGLATNQKAAGSSPAERAPNCPAKAVFLPPGISPKVGLCHLFDHLSFLNRFRRGYLCARSRYCNGSASNHTLRHVLWHVVYDGLCCLGRLIGKYMPRSMLFTSSWPRVYSS